MSQKFDYTALQKEEKRLQNDAKKNLAARNAAIKKEKALLKDQEKLKKFGGLFDTEQIEIFAGLQGKITEQEKLRLSLQLALIQGNATEAEKLGKQLAIAQLQTTDLATAISKIPKALNPFEGFGSEVDNLIAKILNMYKLLQQPLSAATTTPIVSSGGTTTPSLAAAKAQIESSTAKLNAFNERMLEKIAATNKIPNTTIEQDIQSQLQSYLAADTAMRNTFKDLNINIAPAGSVVTTGDLTVDTSTLKVVAASDVVGINTASPLTGNDAGLTIGAIGTVKALNIGLQNTFARLREKDAIDAFAITTNITASNTQDDATKSSWKVRFGFGNGNDNFLIGRSNVGSTTFQDIYSVSATSAVWSDGAGGTRMTLNASGLGVGTSPTSKLTIKPSASSSGIFEVLTGSTNTDSIRVSGGGTVNSWLELRGYLGVKLYSDATNTVTVDSSGNVGIGVTPTTIVGGSGVNGKGLQGDTWTISSQGGSNDAYFGCNIYTSAYGVWSNRVNAASGAYYISGGTHIFYRGAAQAAGTITPTESARIDASGNLLVGTTSLIFGSVSNSLNIAAANTQQFIIRHTGATAGEFWRQAVDTANTFYILNNATAGVSITSGATSWSAVSDERLKDIIEPISNAIAKIGSLRSVIGKYKNDETNIRRSFLIAQDVQSVLPEAVDSSKPNELGLRYTEVIPLLVAVITF